MSGSCGQPAGWLWFGRQEESEARIRKVAHLSRHSGRIRQEISGSRRNTTP